MLNYFLHDRGETGDGAGTQVIAVRETAGQHDKIATLQIVVFMPQFHYFLVHGLAQHVYHVLIAVGTGENYNSKFHGPKIAKFQRIQILARTFSANFHSVWCSILQQDLDVYQLSSSEKKCIFTCFIINTYVTIYDRLRPGTSRN